MLIKLQEIFQLTDSHQNNIKLNPQVSKELQKEVQIF